MGQSINGRNDEDVLRIAINAHLALARCLDLIKLAQTASTKEEAERFIKELQFAHYQAAKAFEMDKDKDDPFVPDVKKFIADGTGDFKILTELYKKLGAV